MRRIIAVSAFVVVSFSVWPILIHAERAVPAIVEYINCRGTINNALQPRPLAPDWIRQSNLNCRDFSVFTTSTSQLTQEEFNTHWRSAGGPQLMESTLSKLEEWRFTRQIPNNIYRKFEEYTQVDWLSNKLGLSIPFEQIYSNLEKIDLFTDENALNLLALTNDPFAGHNVFLLEVMLKRKFLQSGRAEVPSSLKELLRMSGHSFRNSVSLSSLSQLENYYGFKRASEELIEKKSPIIISDIKSAISSRDRMTFLCPDLLEYVSSKYSVFFKVEYDASPQCAGWYHEVSIVAETRLESIRDGFLANQTETLLQERIE